MDPLPQRTARLQPPELPPDEGLVVLVDRGQIGALVHQHPEPPVHGQIVPAQVAGGIRRVLEPGPFRPRDPVVLELLNRRGVAFLDLLRESDGGESRRVRTRREEHLTAQHAVVPVERVRVGHPAQVPHMQEAARAGVREQGVELLSSRDPAGLRQTLARPAFLPVTDSRARSMTTAEDGATYFSGPPVGCVRAPSKGLYVLIAARDRPHADHRGLPFRPGGGPLHRVPHGLHPDRPVQPPLHLVRHDVFVRSGTGAVDPSLVRTVLRYDTKHVCLTGGEPLLQRDSVELLRTLAARGLSTVVETGGSLDVRPYLDIPGVVLSVDVKCPASGMADRNRWTNLPLLRPSDVVKFVIADRKDYLYARRTIADRPMPENIVFQPVWGSDATRLANWVLRDRLDVRVLLQEHKYLWGDAPGH